MKNAVLLAFLLGSSAAFAQTPVTIYEQDFENPSTLTCLDYAGNLQGNGVSSSYNTPGVPYFQANTADKACVDGPASTKDTIKDPSGIAGKYFLGFHGGYFAAGAESIGFAFDPAGYPYLNGTFDTSPIAMPDRAGFLFKAGAAVPFKALFFRIPAGTANSSIAFVPSVHGGEGTVTIAGVTQTAFFTQSMTSTNSNTNTPPEFTTDWQMQSFSVDTSSFASGDRVLIMLTGLPELQYLGVDNFKIVASPAALTPHSVSKSFVPGTVMPGDASTLTINVTGNGVSAVNGLHLTDAIAAPVVAASIVSNSCGGTASLVGNSLQLTDGVVPEAGCQVVVATHWDPADNCSVNAVTNTISDGSDFSFTSSATTAGQNAVATLQCTPRVMAPPVVSAPPTAVPALGIWGMLGLAIGIFGIGISRRKS